MVRERVSLLNNLSAWVTLLSGIFIDNAGFVVKGYMYAIAIEAERFRLTKTVNDLEHSKV